MKKLLLSIFLLACILLLSTSTVFASTTDKITEVPDIKIIMDGKLTEYTDVPLIIQGRTMLPLRELLVNLGVPNDDEHIIWNSQEKSVTVIKGDTRIYLAAGNKTANVNGESFELDVAPIIYKMRTYMPLRFVAEALNMKVVWEGKSKAVVLCANDRYDSVKEILQKYDEAMQKVQRYNHSTFVQATAEKQQISSKSTGSVDSQIDRDQKKMYINGIIDFFGISIKNEAYLSENVQYVLNPLNGEWVKETFGQQEYEELFNEKSKEMVVVSNEVLYAGLSQSPSDDPDEILLKGDVYLTELMSQVVEQQASLLSNRQMIYKTYNVEISLDSSTYLVNRIIMTLTSEIPADEGPFELNIYFKIEYSDFDEDFIIEVPQDVVKSAVESETAA